VCLLLFAVTIAFGFSWGLQPKITHSSWDLIIRVSILLSRLSFGSFAASCASLRVFGVIFSAIDVSMGSVVLRRQARTHRRGSSGLPAEYISLYISIISIAG
jgi:hypothetical protein